jgi:hypothetical protein
MELMALADGELDGAARERAERLVADNEEARRAVEAMRSPVLGTWLGEVVHGRVAAAAADGVADAVMARLDAQSARDGAAAQRGAAQQEDGGVVRLADARARRRAPWVPVMASLAAALAIAAGVAVVLRSMGRGEAPSAPVASVAEPPRPAPSAIAQSYALPREGVEVEEIDSPSRGVSVFEIPLGSA